MSTEEETTTPAERRTAKRAVAGRLSWGLADQAVSSLSNFAVGICVARSLGLTAFGVFSLAWLTYGVVLNVSRGLATDPLMVRFSGVPAPAWQAAVARASGTALGVGAALGAVSLVVGLVVGGGLGTAFACLGVVLPGLLLMDAWRFAFFAAGAGRKAFVNDLVWGIALVPAMVLATRVGGVAAFVLAWGASAAVAAVYGWLQSGIRPRPGGARAWLREHRDLGSRYLVENVANSGASQLRAYGLGVIAGVGAVGVIRGAELLLGPFLAVLMGLSLVTVAAAGLRALGAARRSLRSQLVASACYVTGGLGGAAAYGTAGSAWGVAAATLCGSAVWWLQLRSALREHHRNHRADLSDAPDVPEVPEVPEVRTS
ncbi:hypothetical protein ACFWPY_02990 [Streptomyces sp. NPDC058527]|uniref:hypothetical protein n=1 Tax=Streptomyces sp. NPDC058527 TaxID=3346539 RepID=UPI003662EAB7